MRDGELSSFFEAAGEIVDCRVMTGACRVTSASQLLLIIIVVSGFGFVEFESSRDAEDALQHFNGKSFMGTKYAAFSK